MQRRSMYGQCVLRMEGEWGLHSTNGFYYEQRFTFEFSHKRNGLLFWSSETGKIAN